jgi:DNA-directed RNA polymerase specialized sigma24 family protein
MDADDERLLGRPGDRGQAAVAVWKMEAYTVDEIAGRLGCAPRSVKWKFQLIRSLWRKEVAP